MGAFDQLWDTLRTSPAADAVRQVQMHGGVLPSIYSAADSLKRRLSDAVAHPLDYLQQTAGELHDHPEALAGGFMPDGGGAMGGFAGTFAGMESQLANRSAAFTASQRLKQGHDPATVWRETGWGMGPDGQMRFEIPDNQAKFNNADDIKGLYQQELDKANALKQQAAEAAATKKIQPDLFPKQLNTALTETRNKAKTIRTNADDWANGGLAASPDLQGNRAPIAYEHPDLYQHYPDLSSVVVRQGNNAGDGGVHGSMYGDPSRNSAGVDITRLGLRNDPKSTMAHEFQHGIQALEDFSPGGNPQMFGHPQAPGNMDVTGRMNEIMSGNSSPSTVPDLQLLEKELDRRMADPMDAYRRLGGEAEARLTQARLNMTPAERAAQYPWEPGYFQGATGVGLGIDTIQHTPRFSNQQLNLGNTHSIVFNPANIRSRFAAFDPARANEPDLLAGYLPNASSYAQPQADDQPQPGALTQAIDAP